eukprot:5705557-Lingulodinium_polyedra.AAC.1
MLCRSRRIWRRGSCSWGDVGLQRVCGARGAAPRTRAPVVCLPCLKMHICPVIVSMCTRRHSRRYSNSGSSRRSSKIVDGRL